MKSKKIFRFFFFFYILFGYPSFLRLMNGEGNGKSKIFLVTSSNMERCVFHLNAGGNSQLCNDIDGTFI